MPKIPTITASGQAAVLTLPRPGPGAFGAQGFRQVSEEFGKIATKLQRGHKGIESNTLTPWFLRFHVARPC